MFVGYPAFIRTEVGKFYHKINSNPRKFTNWSVIIDTSNAEFFEVLKIGRPLYLA
jgi:hypothetical protein